MIENLSIRKVKEEDNLLLAKMIRKVFDEHNAPHEGTVYTDPTTDNLFKLFQIPKAVLWVAEIDKQPMGCCGVYPTPGLNSDCAELVKFYLSNEIRGKGIGKQLMEQCISSASEMGFKFLYIESMPEFAKAVSIYKKQGFKTLDAPLGNSGHSGCDIWMLKELGEGKF
jgi:putative acetyltransferase